LTDTSVPAGSAGSVARAALTWTRVRRLGGGGKPRAADQHGERNDPDVTAHAGIIRQRA